MRDQSHATLPVCGEAASEACGKAKICSKRRAVAANHSAEQQSARAYTMAGRRAKLSGSEMTRLAVLYQNGEIV